MERKLSFASPELLYDQQLVCHLFPLRLKDRKKVFRVSCCCLPWRPGHRKKFHSIRSMVCAESRYLDSLADASSDLKNSTDDALAPYLTTLPPPYKFIQDHTHTNVKLAIGYITVAIAGILFYADYKLGWDKTKDATAVACVVYFILNGFLTYWIWKVEAGKVFVGIREGGQKVRHVAVTLTIQS